MAPAQPRSFWHKAFNLLPQRARADIRQAIMVEVERLSEAPAARDVSPSGQELAMAAARSLYRKARTQGLGALFRQAKAQHAGEAIPSTDITIDNVVSKDATPELLRTIGSYNLVQFDGRFYGCPHGAFMDWNNFDPKAVPGLIVAKTSKEAIALMERAVGGVRFADYVKTATDAVTGPASEFYPEPELLESRGEYDIVGYEGWIYGIPHSFGKIDLTKTDVTEMEEVIKDVSRDVVVSEIDYLIRQSRGVAAE